MPGNEVISVSTDISLAISRPENVTAYTALDVIGVADAVTAANAGSAIHTFAGVPRRAIIQDVSLAVHLASIPASMAAFRVHYYSVSPTAILDNAAMNLAIADLPNYCGFTDLTTVVDYGASLFTQNAAANKRVYAPSGNIYVVLQTIGGYTPTSSEDYRLTLRLVEA